MAFCDSALAHTGTGLPGGFVSGFRHPFSGADHLLAMVSVGLWGAFLGRPRVYLLPVVFPAVMVGGAILGMLGVPLPPVDMGIAFSVLILGACIAKPMGTKTCRGCCVFLRAIAWLPWYCAAPPVAAHDFWLQPNAYWAEPASSIPFTLQVGHGPFRQRSPIPLQRITRFEAIAPGGVVIDMRSQLQLAQSSQDGAFRLPQPGTYVIALETDNRAQSHLPAIRFNDYLKTEGLTPALEQRARSHRVDEDGSENYSRCAKSIVQVGPAGSAPQSPVLQPIGLPLEIVPEQSPYATPRPASLPIQVIYEGRALAGALVKLTNLEHDEVPLETHVTNESGRATFVMPSSGTWLLNVIWTKVSSSSQETDFETVFSSLSFGLPQ